MRTNELGKWTSHVAMIRLARAMRDTLEEMDAMSDGEKIIFDNTLSAFLAIMPIKVRDEVLHG